MAATARAERTASAASLTAAATFDGLPLEGVSSTSIAFEARSLIGSADVAPESGNPALNLV